MVVYTRTFMEDLALRSYDSKTTKVKSSPCSTTIGTIISVVKRESTNNIFKTRLMELQARFPGAPRNCE